jgi:hypothetical protein
MMQVPYLAWGLSGILGVPYFLFRLLGPYLREIFGQDTGKGRVDAPSTLRI